MRLVASSLLIQQAVVRLLVVHAAKASVLPILTLVGAILLLLGLWTPIACADVILVELWNVASEPVDVRTHILLATLAAALALLGPGAWSIDARLFGWKRIDIRDGKS